MNAYNKLLCQCHINYPIILNLMLALDLDAYFLAL